MDAIVSKLRHYGQQLIVYGNPEIAKRSTPTPVADWPLASVEHAVGIAVAYVVFVLLGSAIMKTRSKPVNVATLKFIYNPVQVLVCGWMCWEAFRQASKLPGFVLVGNTHDLDRTNVAEVLWVFYVSKVLDFMDTVFIILGQKWRQLSFLHVYHHISIFLTYWFVMNAGYDGDIYLTIVLNGFVHFCMYLYYMITALQLSDPVRDFQKDKAVPLYVKQGGAYSKVPGSDDEEVRKRVVPGKLYSPWWKHLVTKLQMAQFMTMNAQALYIIFGKKGQYPRMVTIYYFFYIQSLFWLFRNFAKKTYGKKDKKNKRK